MNLRNKTAIITGGESGIGKAIGQALARQGANVVIAGMAADLGAQVERELKGLGVHARFIKTDVTSGVQVQEMAQEVEARFGGADILVNNAGIQFVSPIAELEEQMWDRVVDVNLKGAFLCTKAVLPGMVKKGWGRFVNISSAHGKVASEFKAPYVAAKHGLIGFTKVLALETATAGITANCICPGYVNTPLVQGQIAAQAKVHGIPESEVAQRIFLKDTPMKRFIELDEVADLTVFLCSDGARSITGQALGIDGGWVMQ